MRSFQERRRIPAKSQARAGLEVALVKNIVIASGLLLRDGALLLVQCRYDGEALPLWTLPGGRQERGEPLAHTVCREFLEETGLVVQPAGIAYVSDSFDERSELAVVNCTFWVDETAPSRVPAPRDRSVVSATFVPVERAPAQLAADVLRVPVATALKDRSRAHYFSFGDDGISVPFFGRQERQDRRG